MKMEELKRDEDEAWPFKSLILLVICGYFSGIVLVIVWYEFHPIQRKRDMTARWYAIICLGLLIIVLFYSRPVRCVLSLAVPSLSSSRGRALLIAVAFFLAAIGPVANIFANLRVLLRSLACSQELLRQALLQILDVIMEPVEAIKLAIELLLEEVRRVMEHVMEVLLRIQGYLLLIIDTLKKCALWLKSVVELCNSEMGTPWTRCKRTAKLAMHRCEAKLGILKPLCHATKIFLVFCYPSKIVDVFCTGFWDLNEELLDNILQRYREFVQHIEEMFDASITFEHDFYFNTSASRNLSDVGEEIMQDINAELRPYILLFGWLDIVCWIMIICIFLKAIYFYMRYMHSREYQNIFLTKPFYAIDRQRKRLGQETVLPLKRTERRKYIKLSSLRLTNSEWLLIARNAFFMLITSLQLFCVCFVDYALFWLLATMSYYGHQQADLEIPAYIDLEVKGGGFVGDIMRGIANAFRPVTQKKMLDTHQCLPLPVEPNYVRFVQILGLCLAAWLVLLCEPHCLRLRHVIMRCFYPERAHTRALYMHNKILTERVGFFKFARRRARAAFMYQDPEGHVSCLNWLRGKLNWCWCCRCILGGLSGDLCVMCAKSLSSSTSIRCDTRGCKGVYCKVCFSQSNNTCCLCKRPIDYGDYSDFSEVKDSSDDADVESFGQQYSRKFCRHRRRRSKKHP
ncbi:DC-STAMP domain-containing protein 2-like [Scaptodrosophila lebanonensis]|uniref:DC-STAMP domain-containing protein 2-like n=1 Tax=Drosophila lebanonensis TaxID=7225 RepID=A0A6J2TFY9_DROLE|nr:DC-STAMP domain-containing protein 2-like [Scaptodrosophila lebanonensis]